MLWRVDLRTILTKKKSSPEKVFDEKMQQVLPQQEQSVLPTQPEVFLAGNAQCCWGCGNESL